MSNEISTPVATGTLISRVIWDNETKTDGIEIIFVDDNYNEEKIFTIMCGENGLIYDTTLLMYAMDLSKEIGLKAIMEQPTID